MGGHDINVEGREVSLDVRLNAGKDNRVLDARLLCLGLEILLERADTYRISMASDRVATAFEKFGEVS